MMATEMIRELQDIILEFGDQKVTVPDQMEPEWHSDVTGVEHDPEHDRIVVSILD